MTVFNVGGSDTFVYNVKAECKFYGSGQLPHVTHTLLVWDVRNIGINTSSSESVGMPPDMG